MAEADPVAIRVEGLTKEYGPGRKAVDGLTVEVRRGEVFGFLGPNGAGKTTTVKIATTLLRPTAGRVLVDGHDTEREPHEVRRAIGVVFQERTLDEQLTVLENLRIHAGLHGVRNPARDREIERLLRLAGLWERRSDLVGELSGGLARRLEVVRAFLHAPRILFLDEPTAGLDPESRVRLWSDILRLRDAGVTVFLTTHSMEEAERADRIAILDEGRLVALDTPAALKASFGRDTVSVVTPRAGEAMRQLEAAGHQPRRRGDTVTVAVADGAAAVPAILRALDVPIERVTMSRPTLEDVFLHYAGHGMDEAGPSEAGGDGGVPRVQSRAAPARRPHG